MSRLRCQLVLILAAVVLSLGRVSLADPDFPKPSAYPISWELNFTHGLPHRMAVDVTDSTSPRAYWYMTYTVTNEGDKEQRFYPQVDLLTADGNVHASDEKVPNKVFEEIRLAVHNKFLEPYTSISGPIRLGPAEARDGVAIWAETQPRMDHFSIFVTGLSGEAVIMKMIDNKLTKVENQQDIYSKDKEDEILKKDSKDPDHLIIFRKTLQLNFYIRGDEVYPGEDEVNKASETERAAKVAAQITSTESDLAAVDARLTNMKAAGTAETDDTFKHANTEKGELQFKLSELHETLADTKLGNEEWIMR